MDEDVLADLDQIIARQQEILAQLPTLQWKIEQTRVDLETMRQIGLIECVPYLEKRLAALEAEYQREQEDAPRTLAKAEALRARVLRRNPV